MSKLDFTFDFKCYAGCKTPTGRTKGFNKLNTFIEHHIKQHIMADDPTSLDALTKTVITKFFDEYKPRHCMMCKKKDGDDIVYKKFKSSGDCLLHYCVTGEHLGDDELYFVCECIYLYYKPLYNPPLKKERVIVKKKIVIEEDDDEDDNKSVSSAISYSSKKSDGGYFSEISEYSRGASRSSTPEKKALKSVAKLNAEANQQSTAFQFIPKVIPKTPPKTKSVVQCDEYVEEIIDARRSRFIRNGITFWPPANFYDFERPYYVFGDYLAGAKFLPYKDYVDNFGDISFSDYTLLKKIWENEWKRQKKVLEAQGKADLLEDANADVPDLSTEKLTKEWKRHGKADLLEDANIPNADVPDISVKKLTLTDTNTTKG